MHAFEPGLLHDIIRDTGENLLAVGIGELPLVAIGRGVCPCRGNAALRHARASAGPDRDEGCRTSALIELVRFLGCGAPVLREAGAGLSSWQLRKIDEVLWHSDGAPPGLSALADLCGLSTRHLMRAFKTATGRTVHAHFEEIRIIGAKMALARRVPLKQVAQDLGFAGPSSFIVAFRRATGETPGRDRQRPSAVMPSP